jgi:mannosyltransferase
MPELSRKSMPMIRIRTFEQNPTVQYWLLAVITLLAFVLRFYKLGEWSFWIDEIFNTNRVQIHYGTIEAVIRNIPPARPWLPLSLLLTSSALGILGISEWSARLVPCVIGVVTIPVLYFPIKRYLGVTVGLLATLLLAISPWHLYWSQNARFYTSLLLLCSLALFAFFHGIEQDSPGAILLFIVLSYLAASERLLALFIAPIVLSYLFLLVIASPQRPPGLRKRNLLLLLLPGIALVLFELYQFITTGISMLAYEGQFFVGQSNISPLRLLFAIVFRIGVPWICLGFFGGLYQLVERTRIGLFVFLAAVVPIILLLMLAPFSFTVDRYVFITLPFWIILTAIAIKEIFVQIEGRNLLLPLGVLALVLMVAMGENLLYYQFQNGNRPDWRQVFEIVEQQMQEDDLVLSTRPELGHYYLDSNVASINEFQTGDTHQIGRRIWFVIDEETSVVAPGILQWILDNGELIDIVRVYIPGKSLSIRIYRYTPNALSHWATPELVATLP